MVGPGDPADPGSTPFVKRQLEAVKALGIDAHYFHLRSRMNPVVVLREAARFHSEVQRLKPDAIHAQYGTMTGFFCAALKTLPLVVTFRGSDINPDPSLGRLKNLLRRALSGVAEARADAVICVSDELRARLWFGKARSEVLPSGVDLVAFRPVDRAQARRELRLDPAAEYVLFNAKTGSTGKRIELAEQALALVVQKRAAARLLRVDGNVPPDRMHLYYSAADCLLMCSDFEGSPNVVKEALACNLPVVARPVGDVRARLAGVRPSVVVEGTPSAIAAGIVDVLSQGGRSNGRSVVEAISEPAIAHRLIAIYGATQGNGRHGAPGSNDQETQEKASC